MNHSFITNYMFFTDQSLNGSIIAKHLYP